MEVFLAIGVCAMAAVYLYTAAQSPVETTLFVPFFKSIALPLGIGFVLLSLFDDCGYE